MCCFTLIKPFILRKLSHREASASKSTCHQGWWPKFSDGTHMVESMNGLLQAVLWPWSWRWVMGCTCMHGMQKKIMCIYINLYKFCLGMVTLNVFISTQEADLTICIALIIHKKSGTKISQVLNSHIFLWVQCQLELQSYIAWLCLLKHNNNN